MSATLAPDDGKHSSGNRTLIVSVPLVLVTLVGGVILLLATAPPTPEPDRIVPNEWITSERSRFFLWGERAAEVKNPAQDVVHAYFINHKPTKSSVEKAEACVRTELARFTTASCFAFLSEEAIEFAGLPAQGGEPAVACWVAVATATRDPGGEITMDSRDNPQIDPSCPV